jgi:hypothetical protein
VFSGKVIRKDIQDMSKNDTIRVLVFGLVVALVMGQWRNPLILVNKSLPLGVPATFVDQKTGKAHIVFPMFDPIKRADFDYYMALTPGDEKTAPIQLAEMSASSQVFQPTITGAHNGKDLFVAMILQRQDDGGITYDMFFVESNTDGTSWSNPIIPRGNDIQDNAIRDSPTLLSTKSGRLYLFYRKNNRPVFVTRPRFSTIWSAEKELNTQQCTNSSFFFSATTTYVTDTNSTTFFSTLCYQQDVPAVHYIGETNNNGVTWQSTQRTVSNATEFLTSLTSMGGRDTLLGATISGGDTRRGWQMAELFQFTPDSKWVTLASLPLQLGEVHIPSLEMCSIKDAMNIIYFAAPFEDVDEQSALLWRIPFDQPWLLKKLPIPNIPATVKLFCINNELLAIGTNSINTLLAQRFRFTD